MTFVARPNRPPCNRWRLRHASAAPCNQCVCGASSASDATNDVYGRNRCNERRLCTISCNERRLWHAPAIPRVTNDVYGRNRCNGRRLCTIFCNGRRLWQVSIAINVIDYMGGGWWAACIAVGPRAWVACIAVGPRAWGACIAMGPRAQEAGWEGWLAAGETGVLAGGVEGRIVGRRCGRRASRWGHRWGACIAVGPRADGCAGIAGGCDRRPGALGGVAARRRLADAMEWRWSEAGAAGSGGRLC